VGLNTGRDAELDECAAVDLPEEATVVAVVEVDVDVDVEVEVEVTVDVDGEEVDDVASQAADGVGVPVMDMAGTCARADVNPTTNIRVRRTSHSSGFRMHRMKEGSGWPYLDEVSQ
jgi:hypothetical protein